MRSSNCNLSLKQFEFKNEMLNNNELTHIILWFIWDLCRINWIVCYMRAMQLIQTANTIANNLILTSAKHVGKVNLKCEGCCRNVYASYYISRYPERVMKCQWRSLRSKRFQPAAISLNQRIKVNTFNKCASKQTLCFSKSSC